ncbi:MAG: hypothetical protein JW971_03085 [Synergistales bacterium]|nr:hypothetical protein [Synergistales bacterium]
MKKFVFLFLIAAFMAVMAGGALGEELVNCVPICPPICEGDSTLDIYYEIYGLHCIDIETDFVELCGWVPCPGAPAMVSDCANFDFSVKNTGCTGHVYAWLDSYIPGANVYVSLDGCPDTTGEGVEVGEGAAVEIDTLGFPECVDGMGGVKMKVFSVAECGCGMTTLYFKILADQPVCP